MPQIRKFEQDAIVDSTISTIVSDKSEVIATLEATPEYVGIQNDYDKIADLKAQVKILEEDLRNSVSEIKIKVADFNSNVLNANLVYEVKYNDYCYNSSQALQIEADVSSYGKARDVISNEVAIALLPKDAVNDINSIIESIADKFKIGLNSI